MEALSSSLLKQTLLLLTAIYLLLPSALATPVKYCDRGANYAVKVKEVNIDPNPVHPGAPATFKISAYTGQPIAGGKVVIDVSFFHVHVHRETRDLCEDASCPIAAGDFVISHSQTLPSFTPWGSYTLKMTIRDESGEELSCVSFNFRIRSLSSVSDS